MRQLPPTSLHFSQRWDRCGFLRSSTLAPSGFSRDRWSRKKMFLNVRLTGRSIWFLKKKKKITNYLWIRIYVDSAFFALLPHVCPAIARHPFFFAFGASKFPEDTFFALVTCQTFIFVFVVVLLRFYLIEWYSVNSEFTCFRMLRFFFRLMAFKFSRNLGIFLKKLNKIYVNFSNSHSLKKKSKQIMVCTFEIVFIIRQ